MRKLSLLLLIAFVPKMALALPIGNPADASLLCDGLFTDGTCCIDFCDPCVTWCDAWSVRFGYYGDFVFDRHLRINTNENISTIHKTEIYTQAGYLAFNLYNRFDLFATLGASNLRLQTPGSQFPNTPNPPDYFILETETDFSWSLGARGTLLEWRCFAVGAEVQYFAMRPQLNFLRDENSAPQYGRNGEPIKYHEWQLGVGAAYRYYIASCSTSLVPYAGFKWSRALMNSGDVLYDITASEVLRVENLENDRCWGYAIGLTLVGAHKASVTVEGRFIDERALHVNAQFRY